MKATLLLLLLALPGVATATEVGDGLDPWPYYVPDLRAESSNQRVDVTWSAARRPNESSPDVVGYRVFVYEGPIPLLVRETSVTRESFLLTNGRTYTIQVAPILSDGTEAQRSYPVAATPALDRDLEYLAAGLCATWLIIFGYVAFLARREARLDRKLEQLLSHRGGRNP